MEEVHTNVLRDGFRRFLLKMERDRAAEVHMLPRLYLGSLALASSNNNA